MGDKELFEEAKRILILNRIEDYTVPCKQLYPFQWNWDSGFTCLGLSKFNIDWVIEEYEALFKGQWKNGLLPHIIFHSDQQDGYFPNSTYWQSETFPHAGTTVKTSGITQPPVHGFILESILNDHKGNPQIIDLVKSLFPKILKYHEFLLRERDPENEGLIYIYHPWESGRDNSPVWDEILQRIEVNRDELPVYKRVDNQLADPTHRPTDDDYMKYVYLMEIGRRNGYYGDGITKSSPFLVQDTLFNAMFIESNNSLIRIGKMFGYEVDDISKQNQQSIRSFREKLWNKTLETFVSYDLRADKQLIYNEIGGLTSLFANIPDKEQAERMYQNIRKLVIEDELLLQPSFDPESNLFDPKRYWKGPVWPQMNWLVYKGLRNYEYIETADRVKNDLIGLVSKLGFYEYFDPRKPVSEKLESGYGGKEFSWTSAIILYLIS